MRCSTRLATIFFTLALATAAQAAEVEPLPLADAPPAVLSFDAQAESFEIDILALVELDGGESRVVRRGCRVVGTSKLVCQDLMTVPLEPIEGQPGWRTFIADFADAVVSPEVPGTLVEVEPTVGIGVRAEWSFFWGWYCVIEQSDVDTCRAMCGSVGVDPEDTYVTAQVRFGDCVAYCHCGSAGGIEIDRVPIPD